MGNYLRLSTRGPKLHLVVKLSPVLVTIPKPGSLYAVREDLVLFV